MIEPLSTKLRFGPYSLPTGYGVGDSIRCEVRRVEVTIGGLTDAPIQWLAIRTGGKPWLIVCGDLVRAIQRESATAVAFHWGVSDETVSKWRKALNVPRMTPGSTEVYRILFDGRPEARGKGRRNSRTKAARAKMAATKQGKPLPEATRKALAVALKQPKSEAHRKAISEALRKRGIRPPNGREWTKSEDRKLGTVPDRELAIKLNRSVDSVRKRRQRLGIARV